MDDFMNDIEEGIAYHTPRTNKKMKKRKQLDALIKFRSSKMNRLSKEIIRSSEDELFLSNENYFTKNSSLSSYRRCCNYTRHILSFCLVCIFMIVCVGLAYANIELKNEVQNLSLRVTDVEKRFSNIEINRVLSAIEQLKYRLNLIERWNTSYLYDRLQKLQGDFNQLTKKSSSLNQMIMGEEEMDLSSKLEHIEEKSTQFSEVVNVVDKLNHDAEDEINEKRKLIDKNLLEHLLQSERKENTNEDIYQFEKDLQRFNETLHMNTIQLKSIQDEFDKLNQTNPIGNLTNFIQNSSDKTLTMISILQSDLNRLQKQIEACKCTNSVNTTIAAQILHQP